MDRAKDKLEKENIVNKVCKFLRLDKPILVSNTLNDNVKELCVVRLCKCIGITRKCNYKSDFFNFFGNIMGEALCDKLNLKMHIADDNLRLIKYEHINLVDQTRIYLDYDDIEDTFLDAFDLVDKFKYLIPRLKKV